MCQVIFDHKPPLICHIDNADHRRSKQGKSKKDIRHTLDYE